MKNSVSNLSVLFCPYVARKATAHVDTKALNMCHQQQKGFRRIFIGITQPRNFTEVTRLLAEVKKTWLKATLKVIKNLTKNHIFLIEYPEKGYQVTPCVEVYKEKIKSGGSLDKLKLRIVVSRDLQTKEIIRETWYPTE